MPIIGDEEILARVHKLKLFRSEGNIFIDLYEALLGKPAHKFIAVPNLLIRESDKMYFGVGDSKKEALMDCLKKIKDVPIDEIIPPEAYEGDNEELKSAIEAEQTSNPSHSIWKLSRIFSRGSKETQE
jgi:hypothetical protein